jgi:plastocyanin
VPVPVVSRALHATPAAVENAAFTTPRLQAAKRPPARILVFASEHRLNASRVKIRSGQLILQMRNNGEDDHDIAIRNERGALVAQSPIIGSGDLGELRVKMLPGRYTLYCTVEGHEGLGMTAPLLVVRARKGGR